MLNDKLIKDIRLRKKDLNWMMLRNLLFEPLMRMRSISPDHEEDWLTYIFDVPNRVITNHTALVDFNIQGQLIRVPRQTDRPAPRNRLVKKGTLVTIRINKRDEAAYDVEVDACAEDATMLTRWFKVDRVEYKRILNFIKEN